MKASFFSTNRYPGDEAYVSEQWPSVPGTFTATGGQVGIEESLALAALADELGFDWVSCSEHHYTAMIQVPNASLYAAALCSVVKKAKIALLGPLIPLNNPIRLAEEVAQLDQISGGRVVLLPLRGTPNEFLSYGVNPGDTRAITEEATLLMVRALREKQPFGWQGRHFQFRTVAVWPRAANPELPIYYSGNSKESAAFAAANRFGFAASFFPPALVAEMADFYRDQCRINGWQPTPDHFLYRCYSAVGETAEEGERLRVKYFQGPRIEALAGGRAAILPRIKQAEAGFGLGELRFCGSPDQVVQQLQDFYALTGVGVVDFGFSSSGLSTEETRRSMILFANEVLPRVQSLGNEPMRAPADRLELVAPQPLQAAVNG